MFAAVTFTSISAKAQLPTFEDITIAAGNLVNIQIGDIIIQDITIQDVVDVNNVLNNNDVDINVVVAILNDTNIDKLLTNLLRDAGFISGQLAVVGVVLDDAGNIVDFLVANKKLLK